MIEITIAEQGDAVYMTMIFILVIVLTCHHGQASTRQPSTDLKFYAGTIEANFRNIVTYSATWDILSRQLVPVYTDHAPQAEDQSGEHFAGRIDEPALSWSTAVARFEADFREEVFASEYDCLARCYLESHFDNPRALTETRPGSRRRIMLTSDAFYSATCLKPELFPPDRHLTTTLIKYPPERIREYGVHQSDVAIPAEFFRASGWYVFELLTLDVGETEIVETGLDTTADIKIVIRTASASDTATMMEITLSPEYGYNPVKLVSQFGSDQCVYIWDYRKFSDCVVPVYLKVESFSGGEKKREREYHARLDTVSINHRIDTATFTEAWFELKDYDRFTESVTRANFEIVNGAKVPVSPIRPRPRQK